MKKIITVTGCLLQKRTHMCIKYKNQNQKLRIKVADGILGRRANILKIFGSEKGRKFSHMTFADPSFLLIL